MSPLFDLQVGEVLQSQQQGALRSAGALAYAYSQRNRFSLSQIAYGQIAYGTHSNVNSSQFKFSIPYRYNAAGGSKVRARAHIYHHILLSYIYHY